MKHNKIKFLIPPSEWKNSSSSFIWESLTFHFEKPKEIINNTNEKDLKCKWENFLNAYNLNKKLFENKLETEYAINRYSWVMYNSISYNEMSKLWKKYFEDNFLIFSWMYWILMPLDKIWNYKLPIEAKWLANFWKNKITEKLNSLNTDFLINFLPISYTKMIDFKKLKAKIINVNFFTQKNWEYKKLSHWVKKVKWEYINNICEKWWIDLEDIIKISNNKYEKNLYYK